MALNSYTNNPDYPDRYTRNTNWKKVLPVAGRPIQTAELIEIQSILQDNIKQGFNTLFKNGTVIKGLKISVVDIGTDNVSLLISAGQIYIEGQILNVAETTLNVPSTGLYNIDVIVNETIIDETIDSTLRDPIKGAFTVGTPGASRLVWTTSLGFSREDDFVINGYAIAQVSQGVVLQKDINPFYQIEKSVAQFVYEKSGNFCVEGFETSYIGFDKKIGSDVSKQSELEVAVQQARDNQQRALSNATSLQTRISNLNNQLAQARLNALVDQATYQPIVARLSAELTDANLTLAQYSEDLIDAGRALESANTDLKNIESLITDQQIISISPGVAYIEGYRVATNSASKLFIPQSFPTKTVENAAFTYRAETSQTLRTFSINNGSNNITIPSGNYIKIQLKFDDINNNAGVTPEIITNKFSIEVTFDILTNTTLDNLLTNISTSLKGTASLTNLVNITVRDESQLNSPEITTKNTLDGTFDLTKEDKRDLLAKYISTSRSADTLVFKAQSAALKPSEIEVETKTSLFSSDNTNLGFNTGITINPSTGSLSEELSKSSYKLGFTPVNKVTRLTSDLQVEATLIRSESGVDSIQNEDTVLSIESIEYQRSSGAPVVTYTSPLDYTLVRNNINWNLDRVGTIPNAGTSYRVKYTYTEVLVQDVDYILDRDTDSIVFVGRTPKINGRFNVDYSYFLSRAGIITLDKEGTFGFSLSAAAKNPIVPTVSEDKLTLASFTVNNRDLELQQLDCRRQTVQDLFRLSEDIRVNKENNEALQFDLETLNRVVLNPNEEEPIGIFGTTLNNLDKLNKSRTTAALIPGIQAATNGFFSAELSLSYNELTNPSSAVIRNPTNEVEYLTIPYTERLMFRQSRSTKLREIKPKSKTIKTRANIYISEKVIFKNQGIRKTDYRTVYDVVNPNNDPTIVSRDYFTLPNLTSCDPLTKQGILFSANNADSEIVQDIQANIRNTLGPLATTISNSIEKGVPTTINKLNSNGLLLDAFNNIYAREIELDVFIDGLPASEVNMQLFIDGSLVKLNPSNITSGTIQSLDFSINANEKGRVVLKLNLPPDLLTGTHTLELYKENRVYAKTNFYVYNTLLNQLVITPVKNWNAQPVGVSACTQVPLTKVDIFSEEIRITGLDPAIANPEINSELTDFNNKEIQFPLRYQTLNQTFVPNQAYFLTSAEIKVGYVPTRENDASLNMYLSSATNNLPNKDLLAKATDNNIVETTVESGAPGEYSKFNFRSLPFIKKNKKYNLGLETDSPKGLSTGYQVYTSIVDDRDISTGSIVGNQLYLDGDLFSSIDGITIYQEEKEDITFNLYRAEFNQSHVVDLGSFSIIPNANSDPNRQDSTINYFCLNTRDIIPEGTDIIYKYSLDAARTNKVPFKPNTTICLNSAVSIIYLEAELITNFTNVAPQMLIKGSSISLYTLKDKSEIVSIQTTYPEAYKNITITLQNIKPAGTTIKVWYSPNNGYEHEGQEWFELRLESEKTVVVNSALQLYEDTYSLTEDSLKTVNNTDRKLFRYKIEVTANQGLTPIVRNITSIVS